MQAVYFSRRGEFEVRELAAPVLQADDDVLVRVEVAGLCGTDLHIVSVPQLHAAREGIVLGHEFVGRVVALGPRAHGLRVGDRVIAGPNVPCGHCEWCRGGRRNLCTDNRTLGITAAGGFAEFVRVPARCAYPVPPGLAPDLAVFAEPLSCVVNGMQLLAGRPIERSVVLGAGAIGLYFLRLLRHFGAIQRVSTEPVRARREQALRSGATHTLDPEASSVARDVVGLTQGGADLVVDTTGHLLADALAMTRRGGAVLLFGMDQSCRAPVSPYDIVREEKAVLGCFANNDCIPRALTLIPHLALDELITHRFPLQRFDDALSTLRERVSVKTLLDLTRVEHT